MADIILGRNLKLSGIDIFLQDCLAIDHLFGLEAIHEPNSENLSYLTNCLAGEVGEVANVVKKILRDGESEEQWQNFEEEMVDVLIYFAELLHMTGIDFVAAWNKKHEELISRFTSRGTNGVDLSKKDFQLRGRYVG